MAEEEGSTTGALLRLYKKLLGYKASAAAGGLPPMDAEMEAYVAGYDGVVTDPSRYDTPEEELVYFAMMVRFVLAGLYNFDQCLAIMGRPMGMYGYNGLMKELLYEYAFVEGQALLAIVDKMCAFIAHCAVFPVIPPVLVDCKNCVLCLMETPHSLQHRATRLNGKTCCHIFQPHMDFENPEEFTLADFDAADIVGAERIDSAASAAVTLTPDESVGLLLGLPQEINLEEEAGRDGVVTEGFGDFATLLGDVRKEAALRKKVVLLRENLRHLNTSHADCLSVWTPRSVSYHAAVFIRAFTLGEALRRRLAESLAETGGGARHCVGPEDVRRLKARLLGSVDGYARGGVAELFYVCCLPFNYKYFKAYRMTASRVLWFKHMESLGYSCDAINRFIAHVHGTPLSYWVGVEWHDVALPPGGADTRLYRVFWMCVNVYAFCNNWPTVTARQGDDPVVEDVLLQDTTQLTGGVFIFPNAVGFRHTCAGTAVADVAPSKELFVTLAAYDVLLTKF